MNIEELAKVIEARPERKPYKIEGLAEERMFCLQSDWKTHRRGEPNTMPEELRKEIMRGPKVVITDDLEAKATEESPELTR